MHSLSRSIAVLSAGVILGLVLLTPPVVQGDEWNLSTRFSINHPFQVPGRMLDPNTGYVIKLLDSPSVRNVVQVYNADETQLLTMFLAVADEKPRPVDKTMFTFMETEPGYPKPIHEWFYPGRNRGFEFVYPDDQAKQIAQHQGGATGASTATAANASPVSEPAAQEQNTLPDIAQNQTDTLKSESEIQREKPAETPSVTEQPAEQPTESAAVQPIEPAAPAEAVTEPAVQPTEQSTATTQNNATELPRTAGELPLIGLIGVLCLGASIGLKRVAPARRGVDR